jgi:hypothetical protein
LGFVTVIAPAVVAALIAAVVSVIGFLMKRATVQKMHAERLAFEHEQAQRRTEAEIALAKKKARLTKLSSFGDAGMSWRNKFYPSSMRPALH